MTLDPYTLVGGYLDETLSPEEHAALTQWLQETPQHRQQFAEAVFLHDRLRGELLAISATTPDSCLDQNVVSHSRLRRRMGLTAAFYGVFSSLAILMAVLWRGIGDTPAAAAVIELNRLIVATAHATDQTYQISVEDVALPRNQGDRPQTPDPGRPPKPPLDGAVLHVRGRNQFILIRTTASGQPFITGCNGLTSWAVRPDGPVRVSSDLTRFNRDLPGHESAMSLMNIEDGLEQLRAAYDIQLLPIEIEEFDDRSEHTLLRLLVAVKKKGFRGPRRVEITYAVATGQIRQMRFIEMPYGPERLTLRLTLVEERDLGALFFDHASHHAPERTVEKE